ncbi:unnamed protein product [Symbiodinium sp. CCMP2592]|nr:unnamed protein product [Symbiodinium sp. CCMP2592]
MLDTGGRYICVDVPPDAVGRSVLSILNLLEPGISFRLEVQPGRGVRHGDVLRAYEDDEPPREDVGQISIPVAGSSAARWLASSVCVYITTADSQLTCLQVPRSFDAHTLHQELCGIWGPARCSAVGLHRVPLRRPAVDLFCLPRAGHSTVTVVLTDIDDSEGNPIVCTCDAIGTQPPSCSILTRHPVYGRLWAAAFARNPEVLHHSVNVTTGAEAGFQVQSYQLGLDFGRAHDFGWSLAWDAEPPLHVLSLEAPSRGPNIVSPARHHVATQTAPRIWPAAASPVFSASLPLRTRAHGCSPAPGLQFSGTLFHLSCPHMGTHCTIPCRQDFKLWAIRIGHWVYGACTAEVTWQHVSEVAGLTSWDLPGSSLHSEDSAWTWPADLGPFAGHCGHLLLDGRDPSLTTCAYDYEGDRDADSTAAHFDEDLRSSSVGLGPSPLLHIGALLSVRGLQRLRLGAFLISFGVPAWSARNRRPPSPPDSDSNSSVIMLESDDEAATCQSWCHDLACRHTHFATSVEELRRHVTQFAPFDTAQVIVWTPLGGPTLFEVPKRVTTGQLAYLLAAAGHRAAEHRLHVAFDSQASIVEVLSIPADAPEPSEPVPPSSPSYSGVLPPTPDTTIDGEGMTMTVRASDDTGASTAVPIQGEMSAPIDPFDRTLIPVIQRRVAAHMQGVNLGPRPSPFIPYGCPITIHDPFARGVSCELLTTCIGTGFIFEEMLRDYSARRGWQPLVSVQPQPDAAAIHLIPAAADSSQVFRLRSEDNVGASVRRTQPVGTLSVLFICAMAIAYTPIWALSGRRLPSRSTPEQHLLACPWSLVFLWGFGFLSLERLCCLL